MMYLETICDTQDTFRLERQKNTPIGEWYGINLSKCRPKHLPSFICDNDTYIFSVLKGVDILDEFSKEHQKIILKILKKANKLGWFDHLK